MADWLCLAILATVAAGCGGGAGSRDKAGNPALPPRAAATKLRIYHDPYRNVDWANDFRLKGQHHDHLMADLTGRLQAYDRAGYQAISLMDYSGAPTLSYALKSRLWPPESVVPPDVRAGLREIRVFIPNAEEVGLSSSHYSSPFLTRYVEYGSGSPGSTQQSWQYATAAELGKIVNEDGGLLLAAHAWAPGLEYSAQPYLSGVEIYNAAAEYKKRQGDPDFTAIDRNRILVENWDRALASNFRLVGIAVNDHIGPYLPAGTANDDIRDSGKVIVLSPNETLEGYQAAFRLRMLLAVKDLGQTKDRFPFIRSITEDSDGIRVDTDDSVRWIAHGNSIGANADLLFSALPLQARYVRAEIYNNEGSIVFTQAFSVRPVGDANGDDLVNANDSVICADVADGRITDAEQVAACRALRP